MENQINAGVQNTQQIGQNSVDKSVKNAPRPKVNLWMYISLILLFLLIASVVSFSFILKNQKSVPGTTIPTSALSPTPTTTAKIEKDNTDVSKETETVGASYGLFYPYSDGVIINNSIPTIIGKVDQSSQSYLSTKFGIEKSPVSGENEYFLRFVPGRIKNLELKIDNSIIQDVYGIPQYPTVLCKRINLNPDGSSTYDPQTGKKSPPDDIFTSESECFSQMSADVPPLVFFAKPVNQLSSGKHTLTISNKESVLGSIIFTIDNKFNLPTQTVSKVNLSDYFASFDVADNCSEGYYYDSNYLKIPLPSINNRNLIFGVSFPQTKEEQGSIKRRKIQIAFDGKRFDLFFPQSSIFYDSKSFKKNTLAPEKALFLPKDHLFFTDGTKADPQKISPNSIYAGKYFEIYQVDLSGYEYRGYSIPWETSVSSGCDG